ncbi:hypothetical protein GCM10009828_097220 [Actinoplanes couchii]|uniref:Uncharacterized protein n=1 Tax=Actinoplanes couchii TaxID=403638 RepID=A0ABQ3XHF7_9ACTN|nr:hypothetical protein Aco03nite_063360 [Actinoplanes couchii]
MNRTTRLLGAGAGLVVGSVLLTGPAQAGEQFFLNPDSSIEAPVFGRTAPVTALEPPPTPSPSPSPSSSPSPSPGVVKKKEEVVTNFQSGPWFPAPLPVS